MGGRGASSTGGVSSTIGKTIRDQLTSRGVQIRGEVSEGFLEAINEAMDQVPPELLAKVQSKDKIVVGDKVATIAPELIGRNPRGWDLARTWENADGFYDPAGSRVVTTEQRKSRNSNEYVASNRTREVFLHEMGHAVDSSLKLADRRSIQTAYNADAAAIRLTGSTAVKENLSYFLQRGDAGLSEFLAEGFSVLQGSGFRDTTPQFKKYFKGALAALNEELKRG